MQCVLIEHAFGMDICPNAHSSIVQLTARSTHERQQRIQHLDSHKGAPDVQTYPSGSYEVDRLDRLLSCVG